MFVGLLTISVVGFYIFWFGGHSISQNPGDWGPFGDFFGGILNPIIAGASLLLLFRTIKQNEKALDQAKDMIEQGNEVIKQNAEELKSTREEIAQAGNAQKKLAKIEETNLEHKNQLRKQEMYERNLAAQLREIKSLLDMKSHRFHSNSKLVQSYSSYFNDHQPLTFAVNTEPQESISILKHAIYKAIQLCYDINDRSLLAEHPDADILIKVQITEFGTFFTNLYDMALTISLFTKRLQSNQSELISLLKHDDEFNKLHEDFLEAILKNNLAPYKPFTFRGKSKSNDTEIIAAPT